MQHKFCPRCGTKLPIDAQFCVHCGYKFDNVNDSKSVNQNTQASSNQDTEPDNNQENNQPQSTKQEVTSNREAVQQPKSHHSHQGIWVLVVIIVLVLGLGGYAIHEQRANHYGNDVSKVNQKSKAFSKTTAQNVLRGAWQSAQNEINDGKANDNNNIPMDTYFTSDNNSDYQKMYQKCKHMYQETKNKPRSKDVHFKVKVLSKTPNSHRMCKVKYSIDAKSHGIKPFKSNNMHATFKLTSYDGGDWSISHLDSF